MSKRVRLVAYRNADTSTTVETGYELDLQGEPQVALNFQFSDIKEPQTRKASYSQTFKLPFSDNNNEFFQNWYNVNSETLVFDTRTKFSAALFVGTTLQFEGFIQLKAVYKKAGLYEVVLLSNTADLFTNVGSKLLKEAFLLPNGFDYTQEYNHDFTDTNIKASWDGTADNFLNIDNESLRDTSVDVQKIMYDIRVTKPEFFFQQGTGLFLDMSASDVLAFPGGYPQAQNYQVPITQLRPSMQIKEILNRIIENAGFTYTSSFLSGSYFGKLYMTLGGYLGDQQLPMFNSTSFEGGEMWAAWQIDFTPTQPDDDWGYIPREDMLDLNGDPLPPISATCVSPESLTRHFQANTEAGPSCLGDPYNMWNTEYHYITRLFPSMIDIEVGNYLNINNAQACDDGVFIYFKVWLQEWDAVNNVLLDTIVSPVISYNIFLPGPPSTLQDYDNLYVHNIPLTSMGIGQSARIMFTLENFKTLGVGSSVDYNYYIGSGGAIPCSVGYSASVRAQWLPFSSSVYGAGQGGVDIPSCIDPSHTQKDFLIDIIQRFNLVIIPDPENPNNLLIEPYSDFLASGDLKMWTDKLDLSKEIIVKDTTSLQKQNVLLTDLPDIDLANKRIAETTPELDVYGKYDELTTNNEFAQGTFTNNPFFAPYINARIHQNVDDQLPSQIVNMPVHYEYTYEEVVGGYENPCKPTKPKLFFYRGTPASSLSDTTNVVTYYMHNQDAADAEIDTFSFNTFPICTPFDIGGTDDTYTLTSATSSLYFSAKPPLVGQLTVFNYEDVQGTWFDNALYGKYWRTYLNSIYSTDARMMECYLNLDEVDIATFKFNDEIFIKDTYWRILKISNYQVGARVTTKVTLLKVLDTSIPCVDCNFVVGTDSAGSNTYMDAFYYWCPEDDPSCNPTTLPLNILANESCCTCQGGTPLTMYQLIAGEDLYLCLADTGSFPIGVLSRFGVKNILQKGVTKTIFSGLFGKQGLITGSNTSKFAQPILTPNADDIVIKYTNNQPNTPKVSGETHRIVMSGYTRGSVRGYAYPQGNSANEQIRIPYNTNMAVRIYCISTVVGGSNTTYTVGSTEALVYLTAFVNSGGNITQLGTANGKLESELLESGKAKTCSLTIVNSHGVMQIGLNDTQTDTIRTWQVMIDLSINEISNLITPFDENFAIYQNSNGILFQDARRLIWN